jgi:hypothetical protein
MGMLDAGARFFMNQRREKSVSNREGSIKTQAFPKPNSNAGMRDTISLLTVTTINYLTLLAFYWLRLTHSLSIEDPSISLSK